MQISHEGEIAGGGRGGCDGKDERTNKETNTHMFFAYLLQKNTFDVQATSMFQACNQFFYPLA